jgi:hypothetical protein
MASILLGPTTTAFVNRTNHLPPKHDWHDALQMIAPYVAPPPQNNEGSFLFYVVSFYLLLVGYPPSSNVPR